MSEVTLLGMIKHLPKLHRAVMEYDQMRFQICELKDEADQLRAENLELENNQACDVCSPDDYGWQHNAVEGRVPCGCITESGAYQELRTEVERLKEMEVNERKRIVRITATHCADIAWERESTEAMDFGIADAIRKEYGL